MRTTVLPVHPRTGLTALGVIGGKPVWPVLGAEDPPKDPPADPPKPPEPPTPDPPADPPPDPPDGTDWKAETEKWKTASRKHEDRAKQNADKAKQFDELKRSQMSDQEKAVDQARADAKAEAAKEFGGQLVDAELRAATAGRLSDEQRTALLEGLDRSRFLTDTGEVDTGKVTKFVDAVAPATTPVTGGARMGQGRQATGGTSTLATGRERYEARRKPKSTTT